MLLHVSPEASAQRLDVYLQGQVSGTSRSRIQQLIREGAVTVNDRPRRASYAVRSGDQVALEIPAPRAMALEPEAIPLDIRYEDDALLVVNKPAGMVVHPAPGSWSGTLVHALLHHCTDLSGINGVLRPGIVHRLDKDTTGLLVVAKSDAAHRGLAAQLEARLLRRRYLALVWGDLPAAGKVDAPIARSPRDRKKMAVVEGGRAAITHYTVSEHYPFCSLADIKLETGRTHQIRVHLQHVGHPVFGDPTYGGRNRVAGIRPEYRLQAGQMLALIPRQALHARMLQFAHPLSGEELTIEAPLPADIDLLLRLACT
jgi:23S rRNA pseudouridine1911/1915/1917 synthase